MSDLVLIAGHLKPKSVIIPGGDREEDILLVDAARDHGIVDRCILVGDERIIRAAADTVGVAIDPDDILGTASQEETAARTVDAVRAGGVDVILKGNISTPILNRAMMRIVVRNTISLVTMFDTQPVANGRPMLLTDPGVTTLCNFGRMVGLIENAVDVARSVMGIERPRVAVLSANEKVIDSLPSTKMGKALAEREWDHAIVYGPLSFDLAVSADSVRLKGPGFTGAAAEVAGQADVLVCPSIDAANVLYKMAMETVRFGLGTFAGITMGVMVPYVILSRADNVETKLQSVALCSIASERMEMGQPQVRARPVALPAADATQRVLVVNPGSMSIKLALFEGARSLHEQELPLDPTRDAAADSTADTARFLAMVDQFLAEHAIESFDAVAARGGLLPRNGAKLPCGTYVVAEVRDGQVVVDDAMVQAITERPESHHVSNVGIPLAADLARRFGVPAFIVDPVVADDFVPEAEVSGYAPIRRRSVAHVLSIRAAARRAAEKTGTPLDRMTCVVAHMGGGITVAAVRHGRMVDNTIALLGEGPFTPQRAGTLPLREIIDLCYSGQFTKDQLLEELTQRAGLQSYLGEHRMEVIEKRVEDGDETARAAVEAMAYQIAKSIGAMCVAAGPETEAIILTGGLCRSALVVRAIKSRLSHLIPVLALKDTPEMEAMAEGACRVLAGHEPPLRYTPPPAHEADA
ncbi:MAG: butyrate kinase [Candidatus Brocadiae bacterium]|nr:butyrate kinase [Candidatus Brocadiia bacterium]